MSFSKCEQTSRRCFKERGMIEKFNFWHKKKTEKRKKKVGLESLQPISICACVRARDDVGEEADCQSSGCWISENTEWGFGSKSRDICWLKLFNPRLLYLAIRIYKEIQLFKQFPLFPSIPKGFFFNVTAHRSLFHFHSVRPHRKNVVVKWHLWTGLQQLERK